MIHNLLHRQQEPLPTGANSSRGVLFHNIWQDATVSGRVTIVKGSVAGNGNGSIITWYYNDAFPSQRFPLVNGQFKAILRLENGQNKILFEVDGGGPKQELVINFSPIQENPPVHFCLMVAKDSPLQFDSQDYKKRIEGNSINEAIQKLRMAAYLMSAFTQEQMSRNKFGLRTFQPYEENEKCTLSARDAAPQRPTAHIHVVRMDKTVAELRDPDVAQQQEGAKRSGDLFGWAADALKKLPPFNTDEFTQAACIYLDTHWDTDKQLITAHAALGGNVGNLRLAIFGGHALHTWPKNFEDLVPYFNDTTPTDKSQVANDACDNSFTYEALNVGMGAFMHEVGHSLGCPHEPDGVMLRGYENWNRSFMISEPPNPRRNNNQGLLIKTEDEDFWHRLDILRFRWHPSFSLPGEQRYKNPSQPTIYPIRGGVEIQNTSGVYMVDIQIDGSKGHFEFLDNPKSVTIMLDDVLTKLSDDDKNREIMLEAHSPWLKNNSINDFRKFVESNSQEREVSTATSGREAGEYMKLDLPDTQFSSVIVWAGDGLDGIELIDSNGNSYMFGKKGGSPNEVRIGRDNRFKGIAIRSGYWVDACGVITENFMSEPHGGPGGSVTELVPPRGKRITAISGWNESWLQGVRIHYEL